MNMTPKYKINKRILYNNKDIYRYEIISEYMRDGELRESIMLLFEYKENFLDFKKCINSLDVDNW